MREMHRDFAWMSLTVERIYRRYRSFAQWSLVRFGVDGEQVDDAVQDVFLRVLSCSSGPREVRGSVGAWIWGICRNVATSYRRRARRQADDPSVLAWLSASNDTDPEEACAQAEAMQMVERFLEELEADKRDLFLLTEVDDLPAAEAASRLGININTAYSRLRVARSLFERRSRALRARERHGVQRFAARLRPESQWLQRASVANRPLRLAS